MAIAAAPLAIVISSSVVSMAKQMAIDNASRVVEHDAMDRGGS
jgi:hypothetical protein